MLLQEVAQQRSTCAVRVGEKRAAGSYGGGRPTLGLLALDLRAPVVVVDGGVLEQRGEHEHEAHDQVDVDRLDVRDARQRRPDARADRRHRQHRRYACTTHVVHRQTSHFAPGSAHHFEYTTPC